MPPQPLVVLTGPPGAGKTTVARLLVASHHLAVHVDGDRFWRFVERGRLPPYLDGSQHQNHVVATALGAAATVYAAGGYFTVLDAVLGPWLLAPVVQHAQKAALDVGYVVVRPSLEVTMARAVARAEGELRDEGPLRRMYEAFRDLGAFERYVIDSSGQAPDETAREVLARVRAGTAALDVGLLPTPS